MTTPLAYTVEEAAQLSRRSRAGLYIEIRAGRLKARKHGSSTLILPEDLKAWLESLPSLKATTASN